MLEQMHRSVEQLGQNYVDTQLLSNENIQVNTIKIGVIVNAPQINNTSYALRILYDETIDQKIRHMDLIFDVDTGFKEKKLINKLEMEYLPPYRFLKADLIGEDGKPVNWFKYEILCRDGFQEIKKITTEEIVCVKKESVEKLVDRGYALGIF